LAGVKGELVVVVIVAVAVGVVVVAMACSSLQSKIKEKLATTLAASVKWYL